MQIGLYTMTVAALFSRSAAFTAQLSRRTFVSTTARSMSTEISKGVMPMEDEKMPFYALGTNLAMQAGQGSFKTLLEDDEIEAVLQGFGDTMRGSSQDDARTVLQTYGQELNKILQERTGKIVEKVKSDGAEYIKNFLENNEGAVQTESGLVYCPSKEGEGKQPELSNTVEVHYHGTLTDGTVFDSSVDRGQTIKFPLGGVVKGWQEGLAMMKEGGKATLVIPSDLAYGDGGSGETIPPGATLVFEVELFNVA